MSDLPTELYPDSDSASPAAPTPLKITSIFDTPPYHVNEKGVKFWIAKDLTDWARRDPGPGKPLKGAVVFCVEHPTGERTRLLVDEASTPVYENPSLEAMGVHIDVCRMVNSVGENWRGL
jgi:hypothetical protein